MRSMRLLSSLGSGRLLSSLDLGDCWAAWAAVGGLLLLCCTVGSRAVGGRLDWLLRFWGRSCAPYGIGEPLLHRHLKAERSTLYDSLWELIHTIVAEIIFTCWKTIHRPSTYPWGLGEKHFMEGHGSSEEIGLDYFVPQATNSLWERNKRPRFCNFIL